MSDKILTNLEITASEDCCEIWPKIAFVFGWFSYQDFPEIAAMPNVRAKDGNAYRVNFCPGCGKSIRMVNMTFERIWELTP